MKTRNLEELAARRFGDDWQAPFAAYYGVSARTLRHWLAGNFIPQWVKPALSDAIAVRDNAERSTKRARAGSRRRAGELAT